jgi:hypothetical protein
MIPNTFLNEQNEVIFLDYIIDSNYDLSIFNLILSGICLTVKKENIQKIDILSLKEKYTCEIIDFDAFEMAKCMKTYNLLEQSFIIKIIGTSDEDIKHS